MDEFKTIDVKTILAFGEHGLTNKLSLFSPLTVILFILM